MTTVTLEEVKATQEKLAAMIAELTRPTTVVFELRKAYIELRAGERYAGLALGADGLPSHHIVLLPGEAESVAWNDAKTWAAQAGGALPTRQEQALLYANLKAEFEPAWYWSSQEHESEGSYAWVQFFDGGIQNDTHKSYEGRARAVRRVSV